MSFSGASDTLIEEDTDLTFKRDEHVKFNEIDYIITSITKIPSATCA